MKILITCFGAFHNFNENPSQLVMERVKILSKGLQNVLIEWEKLDVNFLFVDKFINHFNHSHDLIIHLGVATGASKMKFEMLAQNKKDGTDNDGLTFNKLPIEPDSNNLSTSFPVDFIKYFVKSNENKTEISNDAGTYLCNYVYFKSLKNWMEKSNIIFIHLADFQNNDLAITEEEQTILVYSFLKDSIHYIKNLKKDPTLIEI